MPFTLLNMLCVLPLIIRPNLYKQMLRVFFGVVTVLEGRAGLVTKKFVLFGASKEMPDGRILVTKGKAGFHAKIFAPSLYFLMWLWQFDTTM